LGRPELAAKVQQAVAADIAERGDARRSTSEVGDAIVARIGAH
jgi:3-isopropylmalate dehydrogenase